MLRKNTASQFIHFQGVDATTGGIKSGVTWTMRRCIDGTFAAGGGTVTEDSTNGWYKCALTQADTNGNDIAYNFTGSGAVPQTINVITTACDPTAAANFGITDLDATISSRSTVAAIWQDTTAGDFTVALSIGKSIMNGVSLGTGLTINSYTGNTVQTGDSYARLGAPAGASIAADLAEIEVETDGIAAISTATPLTAAQIATGVWQDTTAGDFTAANSIGKSVMNGVALGTGLTINAYTGNTVQTGDSYARLGAPAGASIAADLAEIEGETDTLIAGVTLLTPPGIRKNVALAKFEFLMTDSTNHAPVTGKTVTVTRSIDNGAFAAGALSAVTEISNGIYSVDFAAGDLNGGVVTLRATASSCDDTLVTIVTNP